jgi:hypothetical protein
MKPIMYAGTATEAVPTQATALLATHNERLESYEASLDNIVARIKGPGACDSEARQEYASDLQSQLCRQTNTLGRIDQLICEIQVAL